MVPPPAERPDLLDFLQSAQRRSFVPLGRNRQQVRADASDTSRAAPSGPGRGHASVGNQITRGGVPVAPSPNSSRTTDPSLPIQTRQRSESTAAPPTTAPGALAHSQSSPISDQQLNIAAEAEASNYGGTWSTTKVTKHAPIVTQGGSSGPDIPGETLAAQSRNDNLVVELNAAAQNLDGHRRRDDGSVGYRAQLRVVTGRFCQGLSTVGEAYRLLVASSPWLGRLVKWAAATAVLAVMLVLIVSFIFYCLERCALRLLQFIINLANMFGLSLLTQTFRLLTDRAGRTDTTRPPPFRSLMSQQLCNDLDGMSSPFHKAGTILALKPDEAWSELKRDGQDIFWDTLSFDTAEEDLEQIVSDINKINFEAYTSWTQTLSISQIVKAERRACALKLGCDPNSIGSLLTTFLTRIPLILDYGRTAAHFEASMWAIQGRVAVHRNRLESVRDRLSTFNSTLMAHLEAEQKTDEVRKSQVTRLVYWDGMCLSSYMLCYPISTSPEVFEAADMEHTHSAHAQQMTEEVKKAHVAAQKVFGHLQYLGLKLNEVRLRSTKRRRLVWMLRDEEFQSTIGALVSEVGQFDQALPRNVVGRGMVARVGQTLADLKLVGRGGTR